MKLKLAAIFVCNLLVCSTAMWLFMSVQIFASDANSRGSFIGSFFAFLSMFLLMVLAWVYFKQRLDALSGAIKRLSDK